MYLNTYGAVAPLDLGSLDQAGCKSRDVHEWQGPEGESQQANSQDRPLQYFSENLPHTGIEPALSENFSPRQLRPYQLAYAPGGDIISSLNMMGHFVFEQATVIAVHKAAGVAALHATLFFGANLEHKMIKVKSSKFITTTQH
ncbi:Uncharacterized protein Fot_21510 [Forsythia ovata]|uniref:Uncharacterized protein n=1 Tax=Forsythia ovata TaxID=205694 RepID=A0ABD1UV16_9LAMI